MHSYMEQVSVLPMYAVEERKAGERRPMRIAVVATSLALMACVAVIMVAGEGNRGSAVVLEDAAKPKFVDWKKEDAGSDDMNLHLKVADALAKADGMSQAGLAPVPEGLLKMAQRAAEEQKTMPGVQKGENAKPALPASREKPSYSRPPPLCRPGTECGVRSQWRRCSSRLWTSSTWRSSPRRGRR